jgi:hypothetical protein
VQLNPDATTSNDICIAALKDSGAIGVGQTPLAENISDAQARLQWMLQQWERKRWLVYHLVTQSVLCTGAQSYTVGPAGDFDTGTGNQFTNQFNFQVGNAPGFQVFPASARPARLESAFLRQLQVNGNGPPADGSNQIDYPLTLLNSMEDYNRIALKSLQTFPSYVFYDSGWPLGTVYPWPVPQANIYELHLTYMAQLPPTFATGASIISLPYEYLDAMISNLALRLRTLFSLPTFPGDMLPGRARDSLATVRGANVQIARLQVPGDLIRPGLYNIFSDRMY